MNQTPQKPDGKQSALLSELKKRKTQQLQQAVEEKRRTQLTGQAPAQAAPKVELAHPRRTTQVAPVVPPAPTPKRATQTVETPTPSKALNRSRQMALMLLCVGLLIVAICSAIVLLATNSAAVPTSTLPVLPNVTAKEVVNYLKSVDVPVTAVRELTVALDTWAANQEFEVELRRGTDKGLLLILSYAVPQQKITDMFRVNANPKFKNWQVMTISNIILLTAPETSELLRTEIISHITQYLDAPYRSFLPTATVMPAQTNEVK